MKLDRRLIDRIKQVFKGKLLGNEPLSKHTTYKVGGKAELVAIPLDEDDAYNVYRLAIKEKIPVNIIGAGSNVIAPDEGIEGIVIKMDGSRSGLTFLGGNRVRAFAGLSLRALAEEAASRSLVGMESIACIPGTVGGAVVMNAGTDKGTTSDFLVRVEVVTSSGKRRVFSRDELNFGYRHSLFASSDWLIVSADFKLLKGDGEVAMKELKRIIKERFSKYPMKYPNAGSVFKRPPGDYAGRLIELSGCKGMKVGGAMVSYEHANFIVNTGGATARDIVELIKKVQMRVFEKTGVLLEPEQIVLGS